MDKVVILAGGMGTRMRKDNAEASLDPGQEAVAATGVKALMPIDRPFLDYVLGDLADAGYRRVCLVIGPKHDAVRHYFGEELVCERLRIDFAEQASPQGTADALAAAETWVGDEPFLMLNSDNYYPRSALAALRDIGGPGVAVFGWNSMLAKGNVPEERLSAFAVIESGPDGRLSRIVEKPNEEELKTFNVNWGLGMNCWRFDARIFAACRAIERSARGEFELPDAVAWARGKGVSFRALHIDEAVLDLSSRADVASIAALLVGRSVSL